MTIDKKFQIDNTIINVLEEKCIDFRTILKSTVQFILAIELYIQSNTEKILLNIIDEYKSNTMIPMSDNYKTKSSFFTKEQDNAFNNISSKNRKYILNQLISIAINNNSYINVTNKEIKIKQDNIINELTLKYFMAFTKEDELYQKDIISLMKSLLFKINRIKNKDLLVDSYYKELLLIVFEQYENKTEDNEILMNPFIANFIYEELGKIFFLMNIEYNMSLKDESDNFRKWKSKYEPILEENYNNNIKEFITNELNLSTINTEKQIKEFYLFLDGIHPTQKEKALIQDTWLKFMQNLLISGY